jgi:glycosyltransferase involved in cell wall biosynthesis
MGSLRVTFCWLEISGYMAACWRALAARPEVELSVIALRSGGSGSLAAFDDATMAGVPARLLTATEAADAGRVRAMCVESARDVLVIPGWAHRPYMRLAGDAAFGSATRVMAMDTPWLGTLRQQAARVRLRGHVRRFDRAWVAGERAAAYARRLGFAPAQIVRGVYGYDDELFAPVSAMRVAAGAWPRAFLYMGRYAEMKGIDVLVAAYRAYRAGVAEPWPLDCRGQGPLAHLLTGEGIRVGPFVQPRDQPAVLARAGVSILASRYEPWGVAVAEAMAAGLPVICTDAVGASVELVRSYYNGMLVPPDDPAALARAMRWAHEHYDRLPELGRRAQELALPFAASAWAERFVQMALECRAP